MVLKRPRFPALVCTVFENDVNMYGTQALVRIGIIILSFENDVNMYGTQAAFANVMERF